MEVQKVSKWTMSFENYIIKICFFPISRFILKFMEKRKLQKKWSNMVKNPGKKIGIKLFSSEYYITDVLIILMK